MTRVRLILLLAILAGLSACKSEPEKKLLPIESVVFRMGARADGVEMRFESGFYLTSGYEIVATAALTSNLKEGVTITLAGVRAPLDEKGPRAPAAAILFLPLGPVDGVAWPLLLKVPHGESARLDPYTVEHAAAGWRLSKQQGGFSRFEAQGSY